MTTKSHYEATLHLCYNINCQEWQRGLWVILLRRRAVSEMMLPFVHGKRGAAVKRSCQYCGRIHEDGTACPQRPRRRKKSRREDAFRNSYAWNRKREQIRLRDFGVCRVCLAEGAVCFANLSVHHIVPLAEDFELRLQDGNLICLCQRHHEAAEAGRIGRRELSRLARTPPRGPWAAKS